MGCVTKYLPQTVESMVLIPEIMISETFVWDMIPTAKRKQELQRKS